MHPPSPTRTATLRALHGESNAPIVAPAPGDFQFARMPALAPNVHPVVGAPGALACGWADLLSSAMRNSPSLSFAVDMPIGTNAGRSIPAPWVAVAPVGWEPAHAAKLIDAAHAGRCERCAAAALIAPCDASAALIRLWMRIDAYSDVQARARRWGHGVLMPCPHRRACAMICERIWSANPGLPPPSPIRRRPRPLGDDRDATSLIKVFHAMKGAMH
jgi:hypothetical protein